MILIVWFVNNQIEQSTIDIYWNFVTLKIKIILQILLLLFLKHKFPNVSFITDLSQVLWLLYNFLSN